MQRRRIGSLAYASGALAAAVMGALVALAGVRRWRLRRKRHVSETPGQYEHARHRILILGAGFGGLAVARELDKRLNGMNVSILVVDRDNSLLFSPLLWTVADGRSGVNDIVVPIRALQRRQGFHVLQAAVLGIDLEGREVMTTAGIRPYDTLIVALGSITAIPDLPGLREHARVFHAPVDAIELRNRLIDAIEAAHNAQDPEERREWLTFVVSGAGDTGIELAAVIHDYLVSGLFKQYPWLADERPRIVLVGHAPRVVPMDAPETSASVQRVLEDEGIEVRTGVTVEAATERRVHTSAGEIAARTIFWAAGITAPDIVRQLPVQHAHNGAVIVDGDLRLPDHPEVYAVGDCAWAFDGVTHAPIPPTAQAAQHMGIYVGRAVAARLGPKQPPPFRFRPLGHLALLGTRTGVARIGPLILTGLPAWLLWHSYYLWRIPGMRNRIQLLLDWLISGLFGRETSELRLDKHGVRAARDLQSHPAGAT